MGVIKEKETIDENKDFRLREQVVPEIYNIRGMIETTDTVPTDNPIKVSQQFRIYKNGTDKRFYWYDSVNQEWSYITGT